MGVYEKRMFNKIFFVAGALFIVFIFLVFDRSYYIKEIDSRKLSSTAIKLPDDEPSKINAVLASKMIDGIIIKPGEVFSFNGIVGPRILSKGFKEGLSIVQKDGGPSYARDVGGGICRTSTGLHQSVSKAGLEVVERHDHVIPVDYAEKGRDAALLYGKQDYRFRNNKRNPVKILSVVKDDQLNIVIEEKIQEKIEKHRIFRAGLFDYYRDRIMAAYKDKF